jgi:class 3 adenylate cyclase
VTSQVTRPLVLGSRALLLAAALLVALLFLPVWSASWFVRFMPTLTAAVAMDVNVNVLIPLALAEFVVSAGYVLVAFFIFTRARGRYLAFVSLTALLGPMAIAATPLLGADLPGSISSLVTYASLLQQACLVTVLLTFPDGRFSPRWTAIVAIGFAGTAFGMAQEGVPYAFRAWTLLAAQTFAVAMLIRRHRRTADLREREQLRWLVVGISLGLALAVTETALLVAFPDWLGSNGGASRFVFAAASLLAHDVTAAALLVAIGIALTRDRLLGLEPTLNRTLAYAITSAIVAILFGLLSFALGKLLEGFGERTAAATVVGAGVAAVAFGPSKRRARVIADLLLPRRQRVVLLFTDIVRSTERLVQLGDARWQETLTEYRRRTRQVIHRFHGVEVDTAGDGFFVTFDRVEDAIGAACLMVSTAPRLGLGVRSAVHAGECDIRGEKPAGLNVHLAARLIALTSGEGVVVSREARSEVRDGVFHFSDPQEVTLKGVPASVVAFRVELANIAR